MATAVSPLRKLPVVPIAVGILAVLVIVGGLVYLSQPAPSRQNAPVSQEAKAYVPHLRLSDVTMQATENFVKQRVVEVQGKSVTMVRAR